MYNLSAWLPSHEPTASKAIFHSSLQPSGISGRMYRCRSALMHPTLYHIILPVFSHKGHQFSICVLNPRSIIIYAVKRNCTVLWNCSFSFCQFRHLLRIYSSAVSMFYQTIPIPARIRTGSHSSSARFTISCVLFCWLCSVGAFCDILLKAR